MTRRDLLRLAARLSREGRAYALATVVRRTAPSSARVGHRALVEPDGRLLGWLGGSCIEPTIRREAVEALRDGRPRLVVFDPELEAGARPGGRRSPPVGDGAATGDAATTAGAPAAHGSGDTPPGTVVHPMSCHSGGKVEIYVEPHLPDPVLALFGDSPVNRALADMLEGSEWRVRIVGAGEAASASAYAGAEAVERLDPAADEGDRSPGREGEAALPRPGLAGVVATMGQWDEEAVRQALEADAGYVGLVASPRRAAEVRRVLEEEGMPARRLDRLESPAGLDLGARDPWEIAVSILAELIQWTRRGGGAPEPAAGEDAAEAGPPFPREPRAARPAEREGRPDRAEPSEEAPAEAVDPVCGMTVDPRTARHTAVHEGETYWFCCEGCQRRFREDAVSFVGT